MAEDVWATEGKLTGNQVETILVFICASLQINSIPEIVIVSRRIRTYIFWESGNTAAWEKGAIT